MEDAVRQFLEECDSLQGLQVINDSGTFGGFTASFMTTFQDDYRKTPSLVFPLLSALDQGISTNDASATRAAIGDALYLRSLDDIASMTIPIQPPVHWSSAAWRQYVDPDRSSLYHTSAIVAPYLESATLPTRLTREHVDLATLAARLQIEARSPFGELSGNFPLSAVSQDSLSETAGFSIPDYIKGSAALTACRIDVTRGFSDEDITKYETHLSHLASRHYISRYSMPGYPLPSSFPSFLWNDSAIHPSSLTASSELKGIMKGVASLSTTGRLSGLFKKYATFTETCLNRRAQVALDCGIDLDELRELVNDLWTIHDNSGNTNAEEDTDAT